MDEKTKEDDQVIAELVGEDALPVVNYLRGKENITEFAMARHIKREVRDIRMILYALHGHALVKYFRKKDPVKGWYMSYWTLDQQLIRHWAGKLNAQKLMFAEMALHFEKEHVGKLYVCANKCSRLTIYQCLDQNFKCTNCGKVMQDHDNSSYITHLETKLKRLKQWKAK